MKTKFIWDDLHITWGRYPIAKCKWWVYNPTKNLLKKIMRTIFTEDYSIEYTNVRNCIVNWFTMGKWYKQPSIQVIEFDLEKFKEHHRMQVFYEQWCKCVNCNRVWSVMVIRTCYDWSKHIDLFTEDWVMMTVDHIIPRCRWWVDHISNYQPMCEPCNQRKWNSMSSPLSI